jgi:hypothetical protein
MSAAAPTIGAGLVQNLGFAALGLFVLFASAIAVLLIIPGAAGMDRTENAASP